MTFIIQFVFLWVMWGLGFWTGHIRGEVKMIRRYRQMIEGLSKVYDEFLARFGSEAHDETDSDR